MTTMTRKKPDSSSVAAALAAALANADDGPVQKSKPTPEQLAVWWENKARNHIAEAEAALAFGELESAEEHLRRAKVCHKAARSHVLGKRIVRTDVMR